MQIESQSKEKLDMDCEGQEFIHLLRMGVWYFGIASFTFGISDRTIAALSLLESGAPHIIDAIDLMQLFTAATFFAFWLFLKPTKVSQNQ